MKMVKTFCITSLIALAALAESVPAGTLLEGPPNSPAEKALKDYIAPRKPEEMEIGREKGNDYYRQLLHAMINSDATVAQVNTTLKRVGARLSYSRKGSTVVTLTAPQPMNLDQLRELGQKLTEKGVFVVATPSYKQVPMSAGVSPADRPARGQGVLDAFKNSSKIDSNK